MKISVSTICDSAAAMNAAQRSEPPGRRGQLGEDPDVERHRDAVGDDPGRHHPPALAEDDREGLLGGRVHVRVGRQLQHELKLSRIAAISGTKPKRSSRFAVVLAVQLGDRARDRHQDQEAERCRPRPRAAPEGDLLGAEHAGDGDHAAVEDREDEEGAAQWPAAGAVLIADA